jgi:hypothetical protein
MKKVIAIAKQSYLSIAFAVAIVVLFSAAGVWGATTISTNIETGGTLSVTGASTLTGAVAASSTLQVTGAVRNYSTLTQTGAATFTADATFDGGIDAITLTHSNTATSSITVGCVDTFATSTASPIKFMLYATSTTVLNGVAVATDFGGGTMQGFVLWGFGSCS